MHGQVLAKRRGTLRNKVDAQIALLNIHSIFAEVLQNMDVVPHEGTENLVVADNEQSKRRLVMPVLQLLTNVLLQRRLE
jgi:hypothetical protein